MYDPYNLSAMTYANGFTLWHYKTTDRFSDVVGVGYFNDAASMLRVGDFIMLNCIDGHGGLVAASHLACTANRWADVPNKVEVAAMGGWALPAVREVEAA